MNLPRRADLPKPGSPVRTRIFGVPSTKDADESRVAIPDLRHAKIEGILIRGDAPSQIHVLQMNTAFQQLLTQLRKDKAHEVIALRVHVAKRAAYENADGFPGSGHDCPSLQRIE